jgi:hypothetical protein
MVLLDHERRVTRACTIETGNRRQGCCEPGCEGGRTGGSMNGIFVTTVTAKL